MVSDSMLVTARQRGWPAIASTAVSAYKNLHLCQRAQVVHARAGAKTALNKLLLQTHDRHGRYVGGRHVESETRETECLRADTTGGIEDRICDRDAERGKKRGKRLPLLRYGALPVTV